MVIQIADRDFSLRRTSIQPDYRPHLGSIESMSICDCHNISGINDPLVTQLNWIDLILAVASIREGREILFPCSSVWSYHLAGNCIQIWYTRASAPSTCLLPLVIYLYSTFHRYKVNVTKPQLRVNVINATQLVQIANCMVLVWVDATASKLSLNPVLQYAVWELKKDQNKFVFIWKFNGERSNVAEVPLLFFQFPKQRFEIYASPSAQLGSLERRPVGILCVMCVHGVPAHGQAPNEKPT